MALQEVWLVLFSRTRETFSDNFVAVDRAEEPGRTGRIGRTGAADGTGAVEGAGAARRGDKAVVFAILGRSGESLEAI